MDMVHCCAPESQHCRAPTDHAGTLSRTTVAFKGTVRVIVASGLAFGPGQGDQTLSLSISPSLEPPVIGVYHHGGLDLQSTK